MGLRVFISKQSIDVIDWVEPGDGILVYRFKRDLVARNDIDTNNVNSFKPTDILRLK